MTNKEISTKCLALWKLYKAKEITLAQLTIECDEMLLDDLPKEVDEVVKQFGGEIEPF